MNSYQKMKYFNQWLPKDQVISGKEWKEMAPQARRDWIAMMESRFYVEDDDSTTDDMMPEESSPSSPTDGVGVEDPDLASGEVDSSEDEIGSPVDESENDTEDDSDDLIPAQYDLGLMDKCFNEPELKKPITISDQTPENCFRDNLVFNPETGKVTLTNKDGDQYCLEASGYKKGKNGQIATMRKCRYVGARSSSKNRANQQFELVANVLMLDGAHNLDNAGFCVSVGLNDGSAIRLTNVAEKCRKFIILNDLMPENPADPIDEEPDMPEEENPIDEIEEPVSPSPENVPGNGPDVGDYEIVFDDDMPEVGDESDDGSDDDFEDDQNVIGNGPDVSDENIDFEADSPADEMTEDENVIGNGPDVSDEEMQLDDELSESDDDMASEEDELANDNDENASDGIQEQQQNNAGLAAISAFLNGASVDRNNGNSEAVQSNGAPFALAALQDFVQPEIPGKPMGLDALQDFVQPETPGKPMGLDALQGFVQPTEQSKILTTKKPWVPKCKGRKCKKRRG